MNWASLIVLALFGLIVTGFAATASKALQEFSPPHIKFISHVVVCLATNSGNTTVNLN